MPKNIIDINLHKVVCLWPLYSHIIYFIDHYCAGGGGGGGGGGVGSNKHCLLPFFIHFLVYAV